MAFRLVVSDTISVPVSGRMPGEAGRNNPFAFMLQCRRLAADELRTELNADDRTVPEFLTSVVQDWTGVQDADGRELPFTTAGLAELLNIVGMNAVILAAYIEACGVKGKEKN